MFYNANHSFAFIAFRFFESELKVLTVSQDSAHRLQNTSLKKTSLKFKFPKVYQDDNWITLLTGQPF